MIDRSLYVHIPFCIRKCPYCDFNSHEIEGELPEDAYIDALLSDLAAEITRWPPAEIASIFIGGGTPSVFSPQSMARLLTGIRKLVSLAPSVEITMEANPGSVAGVYMADFLRAGINRLSLGIQSFNDESLSDLGRIHSSAEAIDVYHRAREAGFDNINLDLMHGLPSQDWDHAADDLRTAIDLGPEHISWYQLTIEPNTVFYSAPPELPSDDILWAIYSRGMSLLRQSGYERYEISAFARPGRQCVHNLNYWHFGDYLGIGAGAHGKISAGGQVSRYAKTRVPKDYLAEPRSVVTDVSPAELPLEFLMNALRLCQGFSLGQFERSTGLKRSALDGFIERGVAGNLLGVAGEQVAPTDKGLQYLNDLLLSLEDRIA